MSESPTENELDIKNELSSKYNPHGLEKKWYKVWEEGQYFSWKKNCPKDLSDAEIKKLRTTGKTFSIVIPPPNVTGSLHLGHALNHTIQDILTRYHRMKGDITLWVPGTDHAGIATQNVVEKLLKNENKTRWDLGRENFEKRVWEWKKESGGMITHQQRELGESVDWDYERFTMDEGMSHTVRDVFVRLYNEKLIYQGERIINWCPHCVTALSNIEVEYQDRKGKLYFIKYPVLSENSSGKPEEIQQALNNGNYIVIATTRPETMLGDEAVAVHPDDERYIKLHGKKVVLPLVNKHIPVIADDFVDPSFGTGAVKITPAHDPNDFMAGQRHNLPLTRILDDHGKTNERAGKYAGISREKAREKIVEDLEQQGFLEKTEEIKHAVGECYRCQTIVEPISSLQWFVDIKPLAEKAIEVVKNGQIEFLPKRWENTYFEWMNNIQDWCISRQLWWGHRIPAYYCEKCKHAHVAMAAPGKCEKCGHEKIKQDNDVLDTWFSSGLWPFSTLLSEKESVSNASWPARNTELDLFYPTSVLVTGFDIIFFWVARMIMMGSHFMKDVPFKKVYIHGLVRDAERKKMSKSKGNVVNPLEKMEEYGTDAFRFFMISILPEGKDIIYDESRLKGYSAFCNKIWNTARFIWMNQPADYSLPEQFPGKLNVFDNWILKEFSNAVNLSTQYLDEMRFSDYAQTVYDFFWKDFCDNYLELSKTSFKNEKHAETTRWVLNYVFAGAIKLLHPIMPFITEELNDRWKKSSGDNLIINAAWPDVSNIPSFNENEWQVTERMLHLIYKIRNLRGELALAPGEKFNAALVVKDETVKAAMLAQKNHIMDLARLSDFTVTSNANETLSGISTPIEFGKLVIDVHHLIDAEKEKARLNKEIENLEKYVRVIEQKLSNKEFVERAPADLITDENRKKTEAKEKLSELKTLLEYFNL